MQPHVVACDDLWAVMQRMLGASRHANGRVADLTIEHKTIDLVC